MVAIPRQYARMVARAHHVTGLPVTVIGCQISEESGWDPGAVSPAGAEGIAQFLPSTWASLGCPGSPFDAGDAFRCYARYMGQLLGIEHGSVRLALAAYNAGPGNTGAGLGYADTILACAGAPAYITARGGTGIAAAGSPAARDWSPHIRRSAHHHHTAAAHLAGYAEGITRLRPVLRPPAVQVPAPGGLLWHSGEALPDAS